MKKTIKKTIILKITSICAAVSMMLGTAFGAASVQAAGEELPASFSSADMGWVTSVKSQSGETCWAYASLGTLESKLLSQGYKSVDMSVNHLNLWASTRTGEVGWLRNTSQSAYSVTALGYMASWQGGVLESDFSTFDPGVPGDLVPTDMTRYGVISAEYLSSAARDDIKRAIMNHGGVYTSYCNNSSLFSGDSANYYMPADYNGSGSGHAIEVVGWDDDYPAESFKKTPPENGAWLIKNSWGTGGAMGGYFWMSYFDKYVFTEKYEPSYAITDTLKLDSTIKLVQNEIYGATYEFDGEYIDKSELTYLNRFDFDGDYGVIDRVMFESRCSGGEYTLYFVPDEDGAPSADTSRWTEIGSGVIDCAGYHCADIADFNPGVSAGSIAVSIKAPENLAASIGIGEWLTKGTNPDGTENYVFINESKRGQSFIFSDGAITDAMDWYGDNGDEIGATFVIKAVTQKPYLRGDSNMDKKADVTDATLVQMYAAKIRDISYSGMKAADMNGDGKVDISDATLIQMLAAKLID